jgi:hypothetical protein
MGEFNGELNFNSRRKVSPRWRPVSTETGLAFTGVWNWGKFEPR